MSEHNDRAYTRVVTGLCSRSPSYFTRAMGRIMLGSMTRIEMYREYVQEEAAIDFYWLAMWTLFLCLQRNAWVCAAELCVLVVIL